MSTDMTPTTLEQARRYAEKFVVNYATSRVILTLADQVEALTKECNELRLQIDVQAGSIEAVQAANQRLAANHKECVRCLGEALQDRTDLAAAAKLALDALDNHSGNFKLNRAESAVQQHATGALRQAGVQ